MPSKNRSMVDLPLPTLPSTETMKGAEEGGFSAGHLAVASGIVDEFDALTSCGQKISPCDCAPTTRPSAHSLFSPANGGCKGAQQRSLK